MTPLTVAAIEAAEEDITDMKNRYLREHGWQWTCDTPGATWLWQKALDDGRVILTHTEAAMHMQSCLEGMQKLEEAARAVLLHQ